jgi:nicotinate-nucleotide adenylyltransferase
MVKKMAFLGGTFDPPHYGHIWLARKALQELPVQTVRVIPNGVPPPPSPAKSAMGGESCNV